MAFVGFASFPFFWNFADKLLFSRELIWRIHTGFCTFLYRLPNNFAAVESFPALDRQHEVDSCTVWLRDRQVILWCLWPVGSLCKMSRPWALISQQKVLKNWNFSPKLGFVRASRNLLVYGVSFLIISSGNSKGVGES